MKTKNGILSLFIVAVLACSCGLLQKAKYRKSDYKEKKLLAASHVPTKIYHIVSNGINFRILVVGDTNLPVTLLIHGSPGSLASYNHLLNDTSITKHMRLIAMDRPGYGYSHFGYADTSVLHQSQTILNAVSSFLPKQGYNIVGYSFGGPVAATMAGLDSLHVKKLILVSSALGPGLEKIYGVSYKVKTHLFRLFFSKVKQVSNEEKVNHNAALYSIVPYLHAIRADVLMFHGEEDHMVYFNNTKYGKTELKHAASFEIVSTHGEQDAIFWQHEKLFKDKFKSFIFQN